MAKAKSKEFMLERIGSYCKWFYTIKDKAHRLVLTVHSDPL